MTRPAYKEATTTTSGGYTVPAPLADVIWRSIENKSAVIPFMKKWPMTSLTERINSVDEEPIATWVSSEATAKTTSADNFTQLTLTAEELAVIVPFTDRLRDNTNIDLVKLIRDEAENAIVTALEQSYMGYYAGTPFATDLTTDTPVAHTLSLIHI